jgi:IS5 family transposase
MPLGQMEAALSPALAHRNRAGVVNEAAGLFASSTQLAGARVSPAGPPQLSIRLMASLLYLKHAFDLSDEALLERWAENVVWQYFSGNEYSEPKLPCDPTQIGRFRRAIGEAGVEELLKATIDTAASSGAVSAKEVERVIVDSTVQEKAITFPTGSRLLEIARHYVVKAAKAVGIVLKQTFAREGGQRRRRAGGYAHTRQFKRLHRVLKRQRTVLGILLREVQRNLAGAALHTIDAARLSRLTTVLERAERLRVQKPRDKDKLYAMHAPEVECIGKGKARQPYEFGVKASIAITHHSGLVVWALVSWWRLVPSKWMPSVLVRGK